MEQVLEKVIPNIRVVNRSEISKLPVSVPGAQVKLEVNQTMRGVLTTPSEKVLSKNIEEEFDAFCTMSVVSLGQLYGGKICAALDRQHPRDLFDIKHLLENEGFSDEIGIGFLLALLSSKRPINEMLLPNLFDQRAAMVNQFDGMSREVFTLRRF